MDMQQLAEFAGNHPYLTGGFVAVLGFWLFTEFKRKFQGFQEVTPAQAVSLINRKEAVVVDVSALADFSKGHIVDAVHIPHSQIEKSDAKLDRLKGKSVLLVDKNGQTAGAAASRLLKSGVAEVAVLKGGMAQWVSDQLPVTRK
jgi:rhodanese-related sulfurtransferase